MGNVYVAIFNTILSGHRGQPEGKVLNDLPMFTERNPSIDISIKRTLKLFRVCPLIIGLLQW